MSGTDRQKEIDQNLEAFLRELPILPAAVHGKYALLRNRSIVGYYDTVADALTAGNSQFPDKIFSVQQVVRAAADLGYYSHAMPLGIAQQVPAVP